MLRPLVGLAFLAGAANGANAHADDHGDSRSTATRVEVPSQTAGTIDPGDDADWFRFEVSASGAVVAETTGDLDTVGALYDVGGNELAANDDSSTLNFHIQRTLDAGTYFVQVTSFGSATGDYVLRLRGSSDVPMVSGVTIGRPANGDAFELGEAIWVSVAFDRPVNVTGEQQLALTIGTTTRLATNNFYSSTLRLSELPLWYHVQPSDQDKDGISIGPDALRLTIENVGDTTLDLTNHTVSNSANHKVDGSRETAPAVTDVRIWPAPSNGDTYELGESIRISVRFDRRVDVTDQLTLGLTIGSATRQARIWRAGAGTLFLHFQYVVQASDSDADGISIGASALTLNGGTIRISNGTTNASLNLRGAAILNSANHKVDGSAETPPAVRRLYLNYTLVGEGDTYEFGDVIVGWAAFDRVLDVTGEPQLELTIGSATRQASFLGRASLGDQIGFQYVVGTSDLDVDGVSVGAHALTLNGGTIRTRGGTANASLDLGSEAIYDSEDHKVDGGRTTAPTVRSVGFSSRPAGGNYSTGDEIVVRIFFSRAVEVSGVPQLALTIGSITRQADYIEYLEDNYVARYAKFLYFRYVVRPSDHDAEGISIGANALALNGGRITAQGSATNAVLEFGAVAISDHRWHRVNVGTTPRTDDDHGNDLSSATRVALPSETAGAIDPGNDADWFRFEVSTRGEVVAETTGDLLDTVGTLYGADGSVLVANDDSSTLNFRIQRTLDAGIYYVVVRSFGRATGNYALHLAEAVDHGNSLASATRVALPSATHGAIDPSDDVDRFQFDVPARGEVTVETTGILDTVGALYGASGNELALDDDSGVGLNFHIQRTLDAGAYFVQVSSYGSNTGSYVLHLRSDGDSTTLATPVGTHLSNLGDFNGDGKDDVLLRHEDGRWRYYPMDGGAVLSGSGGVGLTRDLAWQIAGIGDFDGDGKDDVLLRHEYGYWHFYPMDGRTVLAGSRTANLTAFLAWQVAGIGDFDGNDRADVLLRHQDGHWHFYSMDGHAVLAGSGAAGLTTDRAWQVAGIGDFDGDDRADVLLRHQNGRWRFYPMDGRTVLGGSGAVDLTTNLAWRMAGIGDLNGDGKDDVLLRHDDGRWRYYPMDGRAVRSGAGGLNLTDDTTVTVAGIGDMNGDGRADVLTRRTDGSWYYYALDGRLPLPASGEVALTGNLAWGALFGSGTTGAPSTGTSLPDQSLTLGRDEAIDLSEAFVDDQLLTYEVQSSDPDVVRVSVTGDVLTLMPVAEGVATVTVTARDPDGHTATQIITVTVGESEEGEAGDTFRDCTECPLMVRIPAGKFTMGSPESEPLRNDDEGPQRTVSIPAFAASAHEVTFAGWDACVAAGGCGGYRPDDEGWGRGDRPVVGVSWDDAQLYIDWLSRTTGQHYRLLTESEWEYAARAGTTTPFHTGRTITPKQANFDGRYDYPANEYNESGLFGRQTVPVGSFAPNAFGLHDMHGNVWEWVQDCYGGYSAAPSDGSAVEGDGCQRVLRGGSWGFSPSYLRAAIRFRNSSGFRYFDLGFRVARTL